MTDVVPILMAVLAFFLLGGVISFAKRKQYYGVGATAVGAVLAGSAAWLWW